MTPAARESLRRRNLRAVAAILAQVDRTPTDNERWAAAAALGCLDWLPDPQGDLFVKPLQLRLAKV